MQRDEILRDSFSCKAAIRHLCQSKGGLACTCIGSVWALNHAVPLPLPCKEWYKPWLVLLKAGDVCV